MNSSTPISLISILQVLGDDYVLLKKNVDFPLFVPGSDIDILVVDRFIASRSLCQYLQENLSLEDTFVHIQEEAQHLFVDVIRDNKLWIRIDLIDQFGYFRRFSVQESLKIQLFRSKISLSVDCARIFVPSNEFDILMRYMEYLEWFEIRPDKIKHLEYILQCSNEQEQKQLIDHLHQYISLFHKKWQGDVPQRENRIKRFAKYIIRFYRRISHIILRIRNK